MRHKKTKKRQAEPDLLYQNRMVAKLINALMKDGKKSVAQHVVYNAFTLISKKEQNPLTTFEKAVQNVGPKQEVKARRVGGASYQVPIEVRGERRLSLAVRWIIQAAQERSNKEYHKFDQKLAAELLDASQNMGSAIRKRDTMSKSAEANRAFAHFRW